MKGKLLQKSIALMLVLCMTMVNFIFVATSAVYALSEHEVSVENGNIVFDAYLKNESGSKKYQKDSKISEGETLFINIALSNGVFENEKAKIAINNANFELPEKIESEYVESVNREKGEIYLKGLNSSYVTNIDLEIPIKFKKQATVNVGYFDMENEIVLSGKYKTSENYNNVEAKINTKIKWYDGVVAETTDEFEKAIFLEDNTVIIQEKLTSKTSNLPKLYDNIKVVAPKVVNKGPDKIVVLKNGEKIDYKLNEDELECKIDFVKDNNIDWSNDVDVYKIIYIYNQSVEDKSTAITKGTAQIMTKFYGYDNEITSKVYSSDTGYNYGTISTITANATSTDVYKGYMYANSADRDTEYKETYNMEISYIDGITAELNLKEDNFKTDAGNLSTNNKTEYKEIVLNKANLVKVLGTTGTLTITPENTELSKIIINKDTIADENGNIIISQDKIKNSHNVKLEVEKAENEGTIKINVTKAIKGNAGYERETLNQIKAIETTVESKTNKDQETSTATATTELKETSTEVTLSMNNNNSLTTADVNKVEFIATIKTGTIDADSIKNPTIRLQLPEDVVDISNVTANVLYAEDSLKEGETINDGKIISVKLDGEQLSNSNTFVDGIKITINADIKLNDLATSKNTDIIMTYTNENSAQQEYTKNLPISILTNESLNTKASIATSYETQTEIKETLAFTVTNHYEKTIENLSLIGVMPLQTINKENVTKTVPTDAEIQITYSEDATTWNENANGAKLYKITFTNKPIAFGETVGLRVDFNCEKTMSNFVLSYIYEGNEKQEALKIDEISSDIRKIDQPTSEDNGEKVGENNKLSVYVKQASGNGDIKNKEIYAGQTIRYTYTIANTTNEDITDVKLTANHENTNVYDLITKSQEVTFEATYEEETDSPSLERTIGTIKPGETKTVTYQVRVKDGVDKIKSNVTISGTGMESITYTSENTVKPAELKLETINNKSKDFPLTEGVYIRSAVNVKNVSNNTLNNITATISVPSEFTISQIFTSESKENVEYTTDKNNNVTIKIDKLEKDETLSYTVELKMNNKNPSKQSDYLKFNATVNGNTYYSNELEMGLAKTLESSVTASLISNIKEDTVKTGDSLVLLLDIKNTSEVDDTFYINFSLPLAAPVKRAYIINSQRQVEQEIDINSINLNTIIEAVEISANEEKGLVVETQIDESQTAMEEIEFSANVFGNLSKSAEINKLTYKLQANIPYTEELDEPENPEDPENPENPDPNDPSVPGTVETKHSILGVVWVDKNKNGIRESNESKLAGVKVILADVENKEYLKDDKGNIIEVTTNEAGEYKFENLPNGKYMVVFAFDNTKYRNTEYHATNATETTNSDIITSKLLTNNSEIKYGVTDTLTIKDKSLENIDAGLIENEVFDLSINKYINKVTVQNSSGTNVKQYNKQKLAKLEIDSKNLAGSTLLVEYQLDVKNEGEVAGYANEIIDYMPKDLTFSSELNKDWYISTDGNLHTTALSKDLIEPGETKTITLILTKTMTEKNTGLTSNKAEIVKSTNELLIPDSNQNNSTSTGELIVSIRTGVEVTIGIIITLIAIATTGIVVYAKARKGANHE